MLREMEERQERKPSSSPRKVQPWTIFSAQPPEALATRGSSTWLTKVFRFCFHAGEIFFVFNDQFLKTEMSLVLQ